MGKNLDDCVCLDPEFGLEYSWRDTDCNDGVPEWSTSDISYICQKEDISVSTTQSPYSTTSWSPELEIYTSCNDTADGVSRLYSPYYPGNYYNNARCTWEIIANTGYSIRLQFEYFSTENNWDALRIYDGPIDD